jgi:hypothetical protein
LRNSPGFTSPRGGWFGDGGAVCSLVQEKFNDARSAGKLSGVGGRRVPRDVKLTASIAATQMSFT